MLVVVPYSTNTNTKTNTSFKATTEIHCFFFISIERVASINECSQLLRGGHTNLKEGPTFVPSFPGAPLVVSLVRGLFLHYLQSLSGFGAKSVGPHQFRV